MSWFPQVVHKEQLLQNVAILLSAMVLTKMPAIQCDIGNLSWLVDYNQAGFHNSRNVIGTTGHLSKRKNYGRIQSLSW